MLREQGVAIFGQQEAAAVDDADPVSEPFRLLDVVCSENDRGSPVSKGPHFVPKLLSELDVDSRSRLVQKQELWTVRERFRDQESALHSSR